MTESEYAKEVKTLMREIDTLNLEREETVNEQGKMRLAEDRQGKLEDMRKEVKSLKALNRDIENLIDAVEDNKENVANLIKKFNVKYPNYAYEIGEGSFDKEKFEQYFDAIEDDISEQIDELEENYENEYEKVKKQIKGQFENDDDEEDDD